MEAILKYDLDKPDDLIEFNNSIRSSKVQSAVWEFIHNSHRKYKSSDKGIPEGYLQAQKDFIELLEKSGVNINDLD